MLLPTYVICFIIIIITLVLSAIVYKGALMASEEDQSDPIETFTNVPHRETPISDLYYKGPEIQHSVPKKYYYSTYAQISEAQKLKFGSELFRVIEINALERPQQQSIKKNYLLSYSSINRGISVDSINAILSKYYQAKYDYPFTSNNVDKSIPIGYKSKLTGDHYA